ncbi:MAG: lipase family protein [Candidatus Hodarchaeales archaeon]|jgi:triacylglycerol lipase
MTKYEFSLPMAALLCNLAREAYKTPPELDVQQYGFELIHFASNASTDTQGFVARDKKRIVVSFRGTSSLHDALTDILILQAAYPPTRRWFFKPRVHAGWLAAYDSVKKEIHEQLNVILHKKPSLQLLVTGHSLGAALATIGALDLKKTFGRTVTCYTFGSPRVGNSWFVRNFNKGIKERYRIANVDDIAPLFPPMIGYNHVENLVYIDEKGNVTVNPSIIEQVFETVDDAITVITGQALKKHSSSLYQKILNDLVVQQENQV